MTERQSSSDGQGGNLGLSRRAVIALSGTGAIAGLTGATNHMTEQIDIGGTDSAVPIRNWQLGPASELPDDSAGGEGDYYFTTTTGVGDFYHDGDTWNEVPVGADEANFGSVHTEELNNVRWVNGSEGATAVQSELDDAGSVATSEQKQKVVVYGDGPVDLTESLDIPNYVVYVETDEFSWRVPDDHNLSTKPVGSGEFTYCIANADVSGSGTGVEIRNATVDVAASDTSTDEKNHDRNAAGIWLHNCDDSELVDSTSINVFQNSGDTYRTFGLLVSDCRDTKVKGCHGGPAGYSGLGVRGDNRRVEIIDTYGQHGSYQTHSMQVAHFTGDGLTSYGEPNDITFRGCGGNKNLNIHPSLGGRNITVLNCDFDEGFRVHGHIRNLTMRDNMSGTIRLGDTDDTDIRGWTIDGHEARDESDTVFLETKADGKVVKDVSVQNIHINRDNQILRISDQSPSSDAVFERFTVRNCTNIAGGTIGIANVISGSTVDRLTVAECYTNANGFVQAQSDATIEEVIFRDCDFTDSDPSFEATGGAINVVVQNDEAEEASNAEEPQKTYPTGTIVEFTDTGDGSGDGTYLTLQDGSFKSIA